MEKKEKKKKGKVSLARRLTKTTEVIDRFGNTIEVKVEKK